MSATHIQFGATMHRINREPLDADSVKISYSDILNYVHPEQNPSGAADRYAPPPCRGCVAAVCCRRRTIQERQWLGLLSVELSVFF